MNRLIPVLALLTAGCADFDALTRDEFDRHPPRPERRFAASLGAPRMPAAGDWLLYRTRQPALRGHAMEGWERVDVVKVQESVAKFRILAQTPSDQIEAGIRIDSASRNERGHYLVRISEAPAQEVSLPHMSSWVRGWHHNLPEGPSRRRAVTPGLVEIDYHYDEQLLVRMASADLGTRMTAEPSALRQDIDVPAGTFEKCVRFSVTAEYFERPWLLEAFATDTAHHPVGPVKIWIHSGVPATGIVRMEFPSGATLELVDFGP